MEHNRDSSATCDFARIPGGRQEAEDVEGPDRVRPPRFAVPSMCTRSATRAVALFGCPLPCSPPFRSLPASRCLILIRRPSCLGSRWRRSWRGREWQGGLFHLEVRRSCSKVAAVE